MNNDNTKKVAQYKIEVSDGQTVWMTEQELSKYMADNNTSALAILDRINDEEND